VICNAYDGEGTEGTNAAPPYIEKFFEISELKGIEKLILA
jgi:hypothetical protein